MQKKDQAKARGKVKAKERAKEKDTNPRPLLINWAGEIPSILSNSFHSLIGNF